MQTFKMYDRVTFVDRNGKTIYGRVVYVFPDNRYNVQNIRKIQWPYTLTADKLTRSEN
jgi:hypothetical protein